MFSPFIVRHIAILMLVSLNFCGAIWAVRWTGRDFDSASLTRSIAQRALAVSYSGAALLLLLMAVFLFADLELTPKAWARWRVDRLWPQVHAGMTKGELVKLLGEPDEIHFSDQFLYRNHPLSYMQSGIGFVNPKKNADPEVPLEDSARIEDKNPDDGGVPWIPADFGFFFRDQYYPLIDALGTIGLLVLTIMSLFPKNLEAGWGTFAIYYPLLAAVFIVARESVQRGGWRFDLFLIIPMYILIVVFWIVRVISIQRERRRRSNPSRAQTQ
jgi:hypothetical protein